MATCQTISRKLTLESLINPTERQREFLNAFTDHRFVLFGGSAGPGKSYILRWWLVLVLVSIFRQLGIKNAHAALFCEDYPSLYDRQISKVEVEFPSWLGTLRKGVTREFVLNPEYGSGVLALRNLDDPSKYLSAEFAAIGVDELTRNKQAIFDFLRMRLRWPGVDRPLFGGATNPGGIGHVWVKNLWLDGKFPAELRPLAKEFHFIKAKPTDNPHLAQQYFDDLATLPEQMRKAYAEGDWNLLAGQYFGVFDEKRHVVPECDVVLKPWWPKWMSGDWGYAHPTSWHWHARRDDGKVITYRELYGIGIGETELGQQLAKETPKTEKISDVFLSPDAFAKKGSANSVAEQVGDELLKAGLPFPAQADNDRIGGARLMHQLLFADQWEISSACPKLIECLPTLLRDEDELEDVLKVDWAPGHIGDDPYDDVRYGLKSFLAPGHKPFEVRVTEKVTNFAESRGQTMETLEPTSRAMLIRRAMTIEKGRGKGARYARGRHRWPGRVN